MAWGEEWLAYATATVLKGSLTDGGFSESSPVMGLSPWDRWQDLVQFYSGLNLTNGQDKLTAIAGVARTYHRLHSGHYLAGHWAEDLLYRLHWRLFHEFHSHNCPLAKVQRPEKFRKPSYIAPSWSWASVDGSVGGYAGEFSAKNTAEIVHIAVTLFGKDPFGPLDNGYLLLRESVYAASFRDLRMEQIGLLVHGSEDAVPGVVIDLCCQRNTTQEADQPQDGDAKYEGGDNWTDEEDYDRENNNTEDDDTEDDDTEDDDEDEA